jgi:hypothetical protein
VEKGTIGIGSRGSVRTVDHDSASVDFPTGEFPIRARNTWVNIHRGSGICETRSCEFQTRDHARSDFPIWSREIIRGILWVLRTSDKGVEEQFSSSGRRKRRSCGSGRALGGAFASEWYQSEKISLFSVAEKKRKFHHAAEERKTITRSRG